MMREVGVPMAQAFQAYREGEYGRAADLLLPVRYNVHTIGGSHAQVRIEVGILVCCHWIFLASLVGGLVRGTHLYQSEPNHKMVMLLYIKMKNT